MKINLNTDGFSGEEYLKITAQSIEEASRQYGSQTKSLVRSQLEQLFKGVSDEEKRRQLTWSLMAFHKLTEAAASGLGVVDGTDWLKRYVDAFTGFCKGANLSAAEGAFLQLEIEFSCQTIVTQDIDQGTIRFVHTEEDGGNHIPDLPVYPYRLVRMTLPEKEVEFFGYPGLCGWGPAFGVNKTTQFVQLVDDLIIKNEFYGGVIWANAVAFMALDCGSVATIKRLFDKILIYPGVNFAGGYALNLIEALPKLQMSQVEFASNKCVWLDPKESLTQAAYCHTNYVIDEKIQNFSDTAYPKWGDDWSVEAAMAYTEMYNKHQRLLDYATKIDWGKADSVETIKRGLKLLADPWADVMSYKSGDDVKKYLCGLASIWTAAHLVGYVSTERIDIHVGKLTPTPLPNQPYSIHYYPEYPYILEDLREEAERILAERNK